ncbi:MAG TPA: response regulator transcription factor [Gammaproteobacteria bacterium]|nr:response regulator transcription factor [Gammaproteobacteria bacterium]
MYILLVEDDHEAAAHLIRGLREHQHRVDYAADGALGLKLALDNHYDVLIIDRMLPKRDGLSLVRALRDAGKITPVLILSALGEVDDCVEGLRSGGDDYLIKPCAFKELEARLESLTRRSQQAAHTSTLTLAGLELNLQTRKVTRDGKTLHLQPRELLLLEFLLRHAGQTLTHNMLLEQVWGLHFNPETNVVHTQISRLRSKIDKGFNRPLLHTVHGIGYCLSESP